MSARRQLVLSLGAALAVLLLVAGIVTLRSSSTTHDTVRQDRLGPVLLVPGYGGSTTALEQLAVSLRALGRTASVLHLPDEGTGSLTEQARALDDAARSAVSSGSPSVDVVGYSAGGVVARLWVAELGGGRLARRVVSLGSPQHGTEVAALAALLAPGSCPAACQQLAPDSAELGRLNRTDETPAGPLWVSLWTVDDQVVTPPSSARLDGALDVVLQRVCPGRRIGHGQLPTDAAVQSLVTSWLSVAPPSVPAACPVRR